MKKLLLKIYRWINPLYQVVYTTQDGRTEMYTITKPQYKNEFGNTKEGKKVVGFRSFCINRDGIRSFRYDRITALNKV
jgi:hypothetical protein